MASPRTVELVESKEEKTISSKLSSDLQAQIISRQIAESRNKERQRLTLEINKLILKVHELKYAAMNNKAKIPQPTLLPTPVDRENSNLMGRVSRGIVGIVTNTYTPVATNKELNDLEARKRSLEETFRVMERRTRTFLEKKKASTSTSSVTSTLTSSAATTPAVETSSASASSSTSLSSTSASAATSAPAATSSVAVTASTSAASSSTEAVGIFSSSSATVSTPTPAISPRVLV